MLPEDIKQIRKLNRDDFERILNKFLGLDITKMTMILKDPTTTILELMVGKICLEAIKTGDQVRLSFILDRLLGKVPSNLNISGSSDALNGAKVILYLPDNGRPVYELEDDDNKDH
jgi:hypothetical protein